MTDLEKIQYTKSFIDKLANGINPLTGEAIPENDLLNNIRISRCMFYVSSLLQDICLGIISGKENNDVKRKRKSPFHIEDNKLLTFYYKSQGMYVGDIVNKLNALIDTDNMKKISYKQITDWLIDQKYLYVSTMENGKNSKRPTQMGVNLGIREELRHSNKGDYYVLIYNMNAQKLIVSNCNSLNDVHNESQNNLDEQSLRGQRWTLEQDEILSTMFKEGILVADMASKLQRTTGAIRARLARLGLIADRNEAL